MADTVPKRRRSESPDHASDNQREASPDQSGSSAKRAKGEDNSSSTRSKKNDMANPQDKDDADVVDLGGAASPVAGGSNGGAGAADSESRTDGEAAGGSPNADGGAEGASTEEQQHIAMRSLIITNDASIIIGKQGKHINEIRDKSGARLTISESIPGNPERIMTVAGQLDAVSKAFGLIVRRINDEPFDQPSVPGSRAVTIRFIVPNSRMGSVIGKAGTKIKEIQEASGARLTAGEAMLPGSTERVLSISGVADAVHIAVYYVGTILLEHPDRNANNLAYRPQAGPSQGAYAPPGAGARGGAPGAVPGQIPAAGFGYAAPPPGAAGAPGFAPGAPQLQPGSQTQQIFIPNDLVGCIIGKGGSKINEIRSMSASHIKIMEPGAGIAAGGSGNERLVTITGPPANIQMAVTLLYQRLEQEKARMAAGGAPQQ